MPIFCASHENVRELQAWRVVAEVYQQLCPQVSWISEWAPN
jgi:hypothetical protein